MARPSRDRSSGPTANLFTDPPGFERLFNFEPESGELNGGSTVYVPTRLAKDLNAARERLQLYPDDPDIRRQACVRPPSRPVTPVNPGILAEDDGKAAAWRSVPIASPLSKLASVASTAGPACPPKPRGARRRFVRVIAEADLLAKRRDIDQQPGLSAAERKAHVKLLNSLVERGEWRPVGLQRRWEVLLAEWRIDMPNFGQVLDHVQACCALSRRTRTPLRIAPILLAGPPGMGKTHFATRLASLLGVAHFVYAMESAETVSVLCGSDKHWSNAEPGMLYKLILFGEHANPVVVLDELDKVSPGSTYKPASALHTVLEQVTARSLREKAADLVFDASYVVYVATANRLSTIDGSLLSRFELFYIEPPDARGSVAIARSIRQEMWSVLKLAKRIEAPRGEVIQQLALLRDPRRMHKVLRAALGRAVLAGRDCVTVNDLVGGDDTTSGEDRDRERAH